MGSKVAMGAVHDATGSFHKLSAISGNTACIWHLSSRRGLPRFGDDCTLADEVVSLREA